MAFAQTLMNIPLSMQRTYRDPQPSTSSSPMSHRRQASKPKFVGELSQCLFDFVLQLLPTQEEMALKEDVRKLLERLIRTIEPESRLLSFGSTANGFSLRNSDMDLCCLIDSEERLSASDLVTMLGDLLERETKFHVKPLPHARIPIVKLSLDPSPGLPLGIACDIGFENRLALENTRLLMCYAMVDPTRVRTMVLFLKVWSKRRKINSPYKGTLSSYGYVLLVIYFLVHVKNPPVLPNLQQMPPLRPISKEDTHLNGHNIWFFDDIDLLRQRWRSENNEGVAELLIDFFRHYARDFPYNTGVASIRDGVLKKETKGWHHELSGSRFNDARERNRLCIEDPFETDYNVARCVTRDGLYTIRGEFMRASRILAQRPERALVALAELCEDRKDEELVSAPPYHSRPPTLPPQTPYTVGGQTIRPKMAERFSPPAQFFEPGQCPVVQQPVAIRPPPEHMAPKRGKWTSPPPPEAPSADHTLFESQLGMSLQLATSSTEAREKDTASETSEVSTDEGSEAPDDDIKSVKSYTEGSSSSHAGPLRRPSWHTHETVRPSSIFANVPSVSSSPTSARGRYTRPTEKVDPPTNTVYRSPSDFGFPSFQPQINEHVRRSSSGPPPRSFKHHSFQSNASGLALVTPLPPSPASTSAPSPIVDTRFSFPSIDPANVYYQASPTTRAPRHTQSSTAYPHSLSSPSPSGLTPGSQHPRSSALMDHYQFTHSPQSQTPVQMQFHASQHSLSKNANMHTQSPSGGDKNNNGTIKAPVPRDILPSNLSTLNFRSVGNTPRTLSFGSPDTPTPATYHKHDQQRSREEESRNSETHSRPLRSHLYSSSVVTKETTDSPAPPSVENPGDLSVPREAAISNTNSPRIPYDEKDQGVSIPREGNDDLNHLLSRNSVFPAVSNPSPNTTSARTPSPTVTAPSAPVSLTLHPDAPIKFTSKFSQSSRVSASSSSSSTRSSIGGYSTSISRSPSPRSPSPPPTALQIQAGGKTDEDVKEDAQDIERPLEDLGVFGLKASDSVSTIRPDDEGVSKNRGNGCAKIGKAKKVKDQQSYP